MTRHTSLLGRRGSMTPFRSVVAASWMASLAYCLPLTTSAQQSDTLSVKGLRESVEILRDTWGIPHIYAQNEHDLFFAQGYTAARDRAFQFEMWRRQATGTIAEILGERALERDIGARLFKYRGSLAADYAHYHPRGAAIIAAFVEGVNAYVDEAQRNPELVPLELRMLGIAPQRWTPEVVISRHQGLLGNITDELSNGRFVARHGAELLRKVEWFHPGPVAPALDLDPMIDKEGLFEPILDLYNAFRTSVRFQPGDLLPAYRGNADAEQSLGRLQREADEEERLATRRDVGSNNWVISPRLTLNQRAIMANDPHRAQAAPSLRYFVHLVAPGWDVIGGGEPTVPGVSIGHNEYGAWGLTIFSTDGEDLYVYKTNAANRRQYMYRGAWETMRTVSDTIPVKGKGVHVVELRYTRHGPVVYEDTARGLAYSVRAAWLEPGGAPYMASLRMGQAKTWEEFREACSYSNIPGENMVWADVKGNIGWQAVGIAPIRPRSSGLVPVPGDGRYDWAGYLPILQKPHAYNPAAGFLATANSNLTPDDFPHRNAIGWSWADPFRYARISEVLGSGRRFSMADMMQLQNDYTSLPSRALVTLLRGLRSESQPVEQARRVLLAWNNVLDKDSVGAGIYEAWYRHLADNTADAVIPPAARPMARGIQATRIIEWLTSPGGEFGADPVRARDSVLLKSLAEAVADLTERFGPDMKGWAWGRYHQVTLRHPMSPVLPDSLRQRFEVGTWPRGGDGHTPGATGSGQNQTSGASFRFIVEAGNWDAAVGTNTPGQSGNVDSPHYRDLFELWKDDRYFPVKYSRSAVESVTRYRVVLVGGGD